MSKLKGKTKKVLKLGAVVLASVLIRHYAVSRQRKNETDGGITKKRIA